MLDQTSPTKASHLVPTCKSPDLTDSGSAPPPVLHPKIATSAANIPRGAQYGSCLESRHHMTAFLVRFGAVLEGEGGHLFERFRNQKNTASHTPRGSPARPTHSAQAPKALQDGQRQSMPLSRGPCRRQWPSSLGQTGVFGFSGSDQVERGGPRGLRCRSCTTPPRWAAIPRPQFHARALRAAPPLSGPRFPQSEFFEVVDSLRLRPLSLYLFICIDIHLPDGGGGAAF